MDRHSNRRLLELSLVALALSLALDSGCEVTRKDEKARTTSPTASSGLGSERSGAIDDRPAARSRGVGEGPSTPIESSTREHVSTTPAGASAFPEGDWFRCSDPECDYFEGGSGRRMLADGRWIWVGPRQGYWKVSETYCVVWSDSATGGTWRRSGSNAAKMSNKTFRRSPSDPSKATLTSVLNHSRVVAYRRPDGAMVERCLPPGLPCDSGGSCLYGRCMDGTCGTYDPGSERGMGP